MQRLGLLFILLLAFSHAPLARADASGIHVEKSFPVGKAPHGMYLDGDTLLVALTGESAIARFDVKTGKEISRWAVEAVPLDVIPSDNGWLVTSFRGEHLIEFDDDGHETGRWSVGKSPSLFIDDLAGGYTAVVSEFEDQLTIFDVQNIRDSQENTGRILKTFKTGVRPYPADITHEGVLAFVPNRTDSTVSVIDVLNEKEVARTPVCTNPEGGALVEGENIYMVACGGANEVQLMNTASFEVIGSIKDGIGKRPFSVTESSDGRFAFVNNASENTVSVIDVKARKVVQKLTVGQQPIVMRAFGQKLFVANQVDGSISIVDIPPASAVKTNGLKNQVLVLGMIHGGHTNSKTYGLPYLKRVFDAVNADYVLVEIPPNRMEATLKGFKETGEITEPRSRRFPEYVGALFPLYGEKGGFEIIPTAGWNSHMNEYRSKALNRIQNDPKRADEWAEYQAAIEAGNKALEGHGEDPYFINSDDYDAIIKAQLEPYDRLFNDELGTGGWTTINIAHYSHIERALNELSGQGKRILITYGGGHKYWFMEQLRKRDDIVLMDPKPFLDAGQE